MGNSLRDQLLKAGLVDSKKVRKAADSQRKAAKQARGSGRGGDKAAQQHAEARRAQAEKAAKDRALNEQRQAQTARKALEAQVRQLIQSNPVEDVEGEVPYHFTADGVVRRVFVNPRGRQRLSEGRLAIALLDGSPRIVSLQTAEKVLARAPDWPVYRSPPDESRDPDDPYADYPVPDDLMW